MEEGWLGAGVAGELARIYAEHQREFLDPLARLLESAVPELTEVTRRSSVLSRGRQVGEIQVELGDYRYRLADRGRGPLVAERILSKRGIVLRTEALRVEQWIPEVGAALEVYAGEHEAAAVAMRRFLGM
jgi:hypothetical protein